MGSSSKAKQEVADYYLSLHIGVCQEADAVTGLFYGEKLMWEGEQAEAGAFVVNKKSLFGGPKKEGGVYGSVLVLPGDENQVLPQAMTRRWGVEDPSQTPAYRGMMSLFFCGYTQEFEDDDDDDDPIIERDRVPAKPGLSCFSKWWAFPAPTCWPQVDSWEPPGDATSVHREKWIEEGTGHYRGATYYCTSSEIAGVTYPVIGRDDDGVWCYNQSDCDAGWTHEGLDELCPPPYCRPGWVDAGPGKTPRCVYPDVTDVTTFSSPRKGFYWSSNTPYLRDIWVRVRRMPRGLSANAIGDDANPAGIIYEVFTSTRFGMGVPDDLMDTQSFQSCADTLFDEGLGLSMVMANPSEADEFLNTVLDHIDGVLFTHPRTGKHTLKLIRGDYDAETLRVINPDNAKMISFQRRGWGETANEITTTWTNPENEQEETVTLQDMGNITQQQGTVIADTRNYFGVRSSALAIELCARELRKAAYPTASCEIKVLREGWDLVPADVVKLYWPDYGADNVVMRISEVDYGDRSSPWITIRMVEDIFSLPLTSYTVPPSSGWVDTSEEPEPLAHKFLFSLPAYLEATLTGVSVSSLEYPESSMGILGASDQQDAFGFDLMEIVTLPDGGKAWDSSGARELMGHGYLAVDLPQESTSVIPEFSGLVGDFGPDTESSMFVILTSGNISDDSAIARCLKPGDKLCYLPDHEICMIQLWEGVTWVLKRGLMDTVPKEWPAGTHAWFVPPNADVVSDQKGSVGVVKVHMLTSTSMGTLDRDNDPGGWGWSLPRPHYPIRPAKVSVGGTEFGLHVSDDGLDIPVSWARRNRLTEEGLVLSWTDGDVSPESGQYTKITVKDSSGDVLQEFTGITGTSYSVPLSAFGPEYLGRIEVSSYREIVEDGDTLVLDSFMAHGVDVMVVPVGAFATESEDYLMSEDGDGDFLEIE